MKTIRIFIALVALSPMALFAANIKLVNDTKKEMRIHTGSGIVKLNKGGSTSFSCKPGKKVHHAEKGSKKGVIFKVESSHCGKTVKLSSVL